MSDNSDMFADLIYPCRICLLVWFKSEEARAVHERTHQTNTTSRADRVAEHQQYMKDQKEAWDQYWKKERLKG